MNISEIVWTCMFAKLLKIRLVRNVGLVHFILFCSWQFFLKEPGLDMSLQ